MKTILFWAEKGGVGKSTSAVHMARILSESGSRVLVIDLDPQRNCTMAMLADKSEDDLEKLLSSSQSLSDCWQDAVMGADPVPPALGRDFTVRPRMPIKITDTLSLVPGKLFFWFNGEF